MGWFLIIFGVAFAVRLFGSLTSLGFVDQNYETVRVALSLAHHNTFADPFLLPTGATAHVAPAFPFLLSVLYRIFGDGLAGDTAKRVTECAVSSLGYALLPAIARACGWREAVGIGAGLWGAVIPLDRYEEISGNFESSWAALLLMLLVWAAAARRTPYWAGVMLLFAPALAPVLAVLALARRWWLPLAISVLLVMPWTLRNHAKLGSWIWIRDNLGLELSLSNRDGVTPSMRENIRLGYHGASHPSHSMQELDRVQYYGEALYNQRRLRMALTWIAGHPGKFAALTLARARWFWFPSLYFSAMVLLAFYGIWRAPNAWIFAAVWLVFPLMYYLIQYDARYRHPMDWTLLLAAANGIERLRLYAKALVTTP